MHIFEVFAGGGVTGAIGLLGYLLTQTSKVAKLEAHAKDHDKLDETRFAALHDAVTGVAKSVERLANTVGGINGYSNGDLVLRSRNRNRRRR